MTMELFLRLRNTGKAGGILLLQVRRVSDFSTKKPASSTGSG